MLSVLIIALIFVTLNLQSATANESLLKRQQSTTPTQPSNSTTPSQTTTLSSTSSNSTNSNST
ncbi:11577_t:CDS:2, partial [Dentiscutata heterogama]